MSGETTPIILLFLLSLIPSLQSFFVEFFWFKSAQFHSMPFNRSSTINGHLTDQLRISDTSVRSHSQCIVNMMWSPPTLSGPPDTWLTQIGHHLHSAPHWACRPGGRGSFRALFPVAFAVPGTERRPRCSFRFVRSPPSLRSWCREEET